jgi:signal transduction histidine kinase
VSVTVGFSADAVSVVISDDGKGFELPENLCDLAPMGKLGLVGMQERAELLDGEFTVQSAPGKGTAVRVSVKAAVQAGIAAAT